MYDKIVKIISQYEEKGDFTHPNVCLLYTSDAADEL